MAAVIEQSVGPNLRGTQVVRHVYRHLLQFELLRGQKTNVANNDSPTRVHDDGLAPSELLDGRRHLIDRQLWDFPCVANVGSNTGDRTVSYFHRLNPCAKISCAIQSMRPCPGFRM